MKKKFPVLFIIANSVYARWFRITEVGVEEIAQLIDPIDHYSDRESFFTQTGHGQRIRGGEPDVVNKRMAEHLRRHIRAIARKTKELWEEQKFRGAGCVLPEELHKSFVAQVKFLPDLQYVPGNYERAKLNQVKSLFQKSILPKWMSI